MAPSVSHITPAEPLVKPKPEVDTEAIPSPRSGVLEDSHVYVHCHFHNSWFDLLIRIWKTTYLVDQPSGARSELIHVENISYAPRWTVVPNGVSYSFLLIFSALPKTCTSFDLMEVIPQPGGFYIPNIARNENDVYHVNLF